VFLRVNLAAHFFRADFSFRAAVVYSSVAASLSLRNSEETLNSSAMIETYLDESGIHESASVCVIAGYFAGKSQLRKFSHEWRLVLKRFSFPMSEFHATDLLKSRKHQPMLATLARLIARHRRIQPVIYGIVVSDFKSFSLKQRMWFTGATLNEGTGRLLTSGSPNKPYFVPFQNCLRRVTDYTPAGDKAHFFFGLDRPFARYAKTLFAEMKKVSYPLSEWKSKDRLGDAHFPLASETAQLQAADLLAHLSYQHMCERLNENDWNVPPAGLLFECIRNRRSSMDHAFQAGSHLQAILERTYLRAGNWDDH